MKQMMKDIGISFGEPTSIMCDNTNTMNISKNLMQHCETKHNSIRYRFLREKVLENEIRLEYVPTKEKIANIITKPLRKDTFEYLWQKLGVLPSLNLQ
jgi:hypothetical protein